MSADEADPDYTEYMTGDFDDAIINITLTTTITTITIVIAFIFREEDPCGWNSWP